MDTYSYDVNDGALGALFAVYLIVMIAIYVVTVVGLWKMYVKAGRPGWAAIIPIYNWWVWVEMIGRPRWWFWALVASVLLSWIPVVGVILGILMFVLYLMGCLDMAKAFGRGAGTGIGLWLVPFVFAPILGFGDAQYLGPVASPAGGGFGAAPPPPARGRLRPATDAAGPPAPPSAPVTPAQTGIPAAPVTPPVTPPAAAPSTPVTPPATAAVPEPPAAPAEAPATADVSPAAPDTGTAATDVDQRPRKQPEPPEAPPAPAGELAAATAAAGVTPDTHRPTRTGRGCGAAPARPTYAPSDLRRVFRHVLAGRQSLTRRNHSGFAPGGAVKEGTSCDSRPHRSRARPRAARG